MPIYSFSINGTLNNCTALYTVEADSPEEALLKAQNGDSDDVEIMDGDFEADKGEWESLSVEDMEEYEETPQ